MASTAAMVCAPNGLALDPHGNLIVADGGNSRTRKITSSGTITTIAGNGVFGYSGDGGPALKAEIGQPFQIPYDAAGNLYFDQVGNCVVRKVDTAGTITTIAGTVRVGTTVTVFQPRLNHSNKDGLSLAESEEGRLRIKENTLPFDTYPTLSGIARVPWVGECVANRYGGPLFIQDKNRMR
jgi:hypothetical protein